MKKNKATTTGSMSLQKLQSKQEQQNREEAVAAIWRPTNLRMRRTGSKGPPTPTPSWKLYENPFYEVGQHASVSARKLAASLWEFQEMRGGFCRDSCSSSSTSSSSAAALTGKKIANSKIDMNGKRTSKQQIHINKLLDKQKPNSNNEVLSPSNGENLGEQGGTSNAGALRIELETARLKVKELENANRRARREIDNLLRKISDEKAVAYSTEHDRVKQALQNVRHETEEERKSRRKMELAHRKLLREVGEAKMALSKALQDRDKERKARALMEDVCDELAREIGQDKAELEELRQESARIRDEVEEERKMLQIAEVWREERVHMKLLEARIGIEEKIGVLENLRIKLQEFLKGRRRVLENGDYASQQADIRDAETLEESVQNMILQERKLCDLPQGSEFLGGDDADDPQSKFTRVMTSPVKLLIY